MRNDYEDHLKEDLIEELQEKIKRLDKQIFDYDKQIAEHLKSMLPKLFPGIAY